ncbi:pilus assembly protein PilZ [bacterium]|nr:MAG: pilus assembly protein PilZ [bacterium]
MEKLPPDTCISEADRRAYPRSPVVVKKAKLHYGNEIFFGYATNVSRSGLFISSTKLRSPGETYAVEFTLPGDASRRFVCRAEVMWARPYRQGSFCSAGFGLRFLDLPEEDAVFIDEWVKRVNAQMK